MVDEAKLSALRERYLNALGGEMFDPKFKAVAEQQFAAGDRRKWPFADVATLLGARYRPEAPDLPDFGGLDFALIGVPMDLGVTNRAGSRFGPRAVRGSSGSAPMSMCWAARHWDWRNSPTSATCRCARVSRWNPATTTSNCS